MFFALLLSTSLSLAVPITFTADLTGPGEFPPNASPGTGDAVVIFDLDAHRLEVNATFSGLLGTTTASHIHCCTSLPGGPAGVATQTPSFMGFPLGVTSGTYSHTFDTSLASSWNAAYITANGGSAATAEAAFAAGLLSGKAYFNIHTNLFPGGEIRGFLNQVPEPASIALMVVGLLGFAASRKRKN